MGSRRSCCVTMQQHHSAEVDFQSALLWGMVETQSAEIAACVMET